MSTGSSKRLAGKVEIITGVARGIGRATAIALAREGADIMGFDVAGRVSPTLAMNSMRRAGWTPMLARAGARRG